LSRKVSADSTFASETLLPVVGFLPVLAAAFALVVGDHGKDTMTIVAVVSFASCLLALTRCYLQIGRSTEMPTLVILIAFLFWFYLPAIYTGFSTEQWVGRKAFVAITNYHAMLAFLAVNTALFGVCLTAGIRLSRRRSHFLGRPFGSGSITANNRNVTILVAGMAIALVFYVITAGGPGAALKHILSSRTGAQPWSHKGYQASSLTPLHVIATSLLTAVAVGAFHLALKSTVSIKRRLVLAMVGVVSVTWVAVGTGTRSLVIGAVLPPLALYIRAAMTHRFTRRYSRFLVVGAILVGLLIASGIQRSYRRTAKTDAEIVVKIDDNDFMTMTAYAFAVHEREGRFFHDSAVWHIVTGPIPRVLWKGKPEMTSMLRYTYYVWGIDVSQRGGNTLPSIVGQYYMSWGWLGVLELALFLGLIMRLLDNVYWYRRDSDVTHLAILSFVAYLFSGFRMLSFSGFAPMLTTVVLCHVLASSARKRKTRSR